MREAISGGFLLVLLSSILGGIRSLTIDNLEVPEVTKLGEPAVLDCDYTLKETQGLVVKWFFNHGITPVYQWIPNQKPQQLGILKGRLDLDYSSSSDTKSAMHINQTSMDLSGEYTCFVSTFDSEDRQTKKMLVYVPEKRIDLNQEYLGDGVHQVTCEAEGLFPEPEMLLYVNNSEVTVTNSSVTTTKNGDLYDIRAVLEVEFLEPAEEFTCELSIPEANYTIKKEVVYFQVDSAAANPVSSVAQLLATLLLIFHATFILWLMMVVLQLRGSSLGGVYRNCSHTPRGLFLQRQHQQNHHQYYHWPCDPLIDSFTPT